MADKSPLVLDKACDITPFADVESTRYALGGVCWDAERNLLAATNSRFLAVIRPPSVNGEFDDAPGAPEQQVVIPSKVLRAAIKETLTQSRGKKKLVPIRHTLAVVSGDGKAVEVSTETPNGNTTRKAIPISGRFPKVVDVLPKRENVTGAISLDQKLLKVIADYFVANGDKDATDRGIMIRFGGPHTPVEISGKVGDGSRRAYVVLMPLSEIEGSESSIPMASEIF